MRLPGLHANFTQYIYWPIVQKIKGEYAASALKELSESQWKPQEELLSRQWQLVRRTVNKAVCEVPYYQKIARDIGWDVNHQTFSYRDFLAFPKLGKESLRDNINEFLNPNYRGRVTVGRTSGSTGLSLKLYYDTKHESFSEAVRWRAKQWWDIYPGSRHVVIWGRPFTGTKDRLNQKIKSYLMNSLIFSAFDMKKKDLAKIWRLMRFYKPDLIYGYPSAIHTLAVYLKENNISADRLGLKVIIITAEASTSFQRALIEDVFGCKTANEYGCSETGGFVFECPEGSWHISSEIALIEFLDTEGKPVRSGQTGEVYITHLRNDYMPLIRYKVGDIGGPLDGRCSCGRGLPRMNISVGKERDFILSLDGEKHTSEILVYITRAVLQKYPDSIRHFRAWQSNVGSLEIEIVPGTGAVDQAVIFYNGLVKKQIKNGLDVQIKKVPAIEREPSGKLRYFISKVNRES